MFASLNGNVVEGWERDSEDVSVVARNPIEFVNSLSDGIASRCAGADLLVAACLTGSLLARWPQSKSMNGADSVGSLASAR